MTPPKHLSASALLSTLGVTLFFALWAPGPAEARSHHHLYPYWLPYEISYLHNYGPGLEPGTFAYYDGPANVRCAQSAAAYIGQDRRRHPCF